MGLQLGLQKLQRFLGTAGADQIGGSARGDSCDSARAPSQRRQRGALADRVHHRGAYPATPPGAEPGRNPPVSLMALAGREPSRVLPSTSTDTL